MVGFEIKAIYPLWYKIRYNLYFYTRSGIIMNKSVSILKWNRVLSWKSTNNECVFIGV